MTDTPEQKMKPDFSAAMTQHIWTRIGKDTNGRPSHVETVYHPNGKLELALPMDLPETSLELN